MTDQEAHITVNQLKVVIESFRSDMKSFAEVLLGRMDRLEEGQAEIKSMLSQKVDREEFTRLEKRVIRIEQKIA
jgi:hypothetical protein